MSSQKTIRLLDCFTSFAMTRTYRNAIASKAKQSNDDPIRQLIHSMLFNPTILNGQTARAKTINPIHSVSLLPFHGSDYIFLVRFAPLCTNGILAEVFYKNQSGRNRWYTSVFLGLVLPGFDSMTGFWYFGNIVVTIIRFHESGL